MMNYKEEVFKGMELLNSNSKTIFIGQAIEYKGTALTHQVKNFSKEKLLELPVAEEFQVIPEVVPPIEKTKVIISIQEKALETVFRQEKIHMVHYRAKNGRLTGKSNVVQINFVPASFSDRSIYAEFLMITAIVHGAQLEKDTVDVVKCVVEDDNGSPVMSLEGNILTYLKYKEALIEKQEWENQLQIVKY